MQIEQLKQRMDRIEESADQAKQACQKGSPPSDLRECVARLHEQASATKHALQGQESASEESLRRDVMQLEDTADRAMQACRNAGNVDPQLQQAVQRTHSEVSSLKKEMMQAA
jgi:chromosome segregation ATPase